MSVIGSNILAGAAGQGGDYVIDNSLRFRSSASAYLSRTPASAGTRTKFTFSAWVKRGQLGARQNITAVRQGTSDYFILEFQANDTLNLISTTSGAVNTNLITSQVFRDPSAWYHVVFTYDSTPATPDASSVYLSINGTKVTSLSTATYPSQNTNIYYNLSSVEHDIGRLGNLTFYLDGYLAELNNIDGQALDPSSFGEYNEDTGVWQPAKYAGSYGTNGFYLNFSDNTTTTTLAADSSGNGNDWTPNNISLTAGVTYDSMTDVPTLTSATAANYCVMNPLWKGANVTLSGANLNASMSAASDCSFSSTLVITSGKWYWETLITTTATDYPYIGVATPDFNYQATGASCIRSSATGFFKASNATKWNLSSSSYGSSFSSGDIMMIAYDADSGKIYFGKNGTWDASSDPVTAANPAFTGVNAPVTPAGFVYNCAWSMNFGQRPFAYTPPTGFKSLHTGNLPDSAIENGSEYFAATTYTGNGTTQSIVNSGGFQPDWVWIKDRSVARSHRLFDVIRGATKALFSDATDAEATLATDLTAFNSNGFALGAGLGSNANTETYVAWNWKAGGAAVTNTAGSITSQVSASPTAGFSVVTYTAQASGVATIGHGLGVAPSMVIIKGRTGALGWTVYHQPLGNNAYLVLNTTAAQVTGATTVWNATSPTATVFTQGSAWGGLGTMVAYCFSEVPGYSKFGSYTGNGSTDGTFVYLGFRPKFVMAKRTNTTGNWFVMDTTRGGINVGSPALFADLADAEDAGSLFIDIISNGFKLRNSLSSLNVNGGTYIFMAFAEAPFKNSLAR